LLEDLKISLSPHTESVIRALGNDGKTALLLAINGVAEGIVGVADVMREEVPAAIEALRQLGIKRLMLLTGDNERVATAIAGKLGIADYRSGLLPEDKIEIVKALQRAGLTVAMIGDGVNDAPALAQADVGIAMGVVGSDVALEAAHVALMRDDWSQIPQAIQVGRRTYRVIRQNIFLGITWDIVTMGLASVGIIGPVLAAATEVVPDVFVSLNSARLLKTPKRLFSTTAVADGSQAAGLVTGART
jgi:Cd2+/Zn2+-exporting ATPase/Cu+-exporting ATPase